MFRKWIVILFQEYKKRKAHRQLKWQALLTRKGIGLRTRILEVKAPRRSFGDYVRCSIQARLRINGKRVNCWMSTLLTTEKTPQKGDVVHIRYFPSHLNNVLIR